MLDFFALLCLPLAITLLITLSVIDLKIKLLPNVYNAALAACGIVFHSLTSFAYAGPLDMLMGVVIGAGLLYGIRFVANWHYNQDTLGLGDVKLLAAAGVWLGADMILYALVLGALAGIAHALCVLIYDRIKTGKFHNLSTFSIPAGPGFAVGIFIGGLVMYAPFVQSLL